MRTLLQDPTKPTVSRQELWAKMNDKKYSGLPLEKDQAFIEECDRDYKIYEAEANRNSK